MTKRLTTEQLEAIRKRTEAATAGPWNFRGQGNTLIGRGARFGYVLRAVKVDVDAEIDIGLEDADFIAKSREDIPALLAEVERLREENTEMRIKIEVTDQSAESVEADNERMRAEIESHAPDGRNYTNQQYVDLRMENDRLRSYINGSPANCVVCGDYFSADFDREDGLYYCERCDG